MPYMCTEHEIRDRFLQSLTSDYRGIMFTKRVIISLVIVLPPFLYRFTQKTFHLSCREIYIFFTEFLSYCALTTTRAYAFMLCDFDNTPYSMERGVFHRLWSHFTVEGIRYTINFALRHRRHSSDIAWKERNLVCGGEQIV